MQYKSVKGLSGMAQFGILLVFFGFGFILAGFAQALIGYQLIPSDVPLPAIGDAMMEALLEPENIAWARLSQVLGTFFMMFIPAVLFALIVHGRNKFWLGFNKYLNAHQVIIGFFIIIAGNFMAAPLEDLTKDVVAGFPKLDEIAKEMERQYNEQMLALSNLQSWPEFFMAVIIMAFFPALFEEVFFRGVMQNLFEKWWRMPILAIVVTSIIFSFIHMSVYLFLSRAVLGFVLGLMYYKTRNIWVNVVAHFLNNAIAVAQLFWLTSSGEKPNLEDIDPKLAWWTGIIALVILFFLFKLLNKYSVVNKLKVQAKELSLLHAASANSDPFVKNQS